MTWLSCKFQGKVIQQSRGWHRPNDIFFPDEYFKKDENGNRTWPASPISEVAWPGPEYVEDLANGGKKISEVVIPLVMLEEVRPINLRLHLSNAKIVLLSDSLRLVDHVDREGGKPDGKPHPKSLWTKEWSWKKKDKARILWHILKNFYITVHGETRWKKLIAEKKPNSRQSPNIREDGTKEC